MEKLINDYINKIDWRVSENANTRFSFSGLKSYIASSVLAKDSLSKLPQKIRDAHKEGKIHIHDLDGGMMPYCYGSDLQQLLLEGLKNPIGSVSKPAKHFDTFIDHVVNYVYISQTEWNGAQAHSNFDTLASAFIIGKDYDYVKQNIQRLIYNISYPLRSSFQTPFYNISFDLIPPKHMENEPVVIGGKSHENLSYGDMQKEMDMINKAFLELMLEGDSQRKPFTFPIPTYGITEDFLKKNDEITYLLYALSAKFGNPNYQNYIGSSNKPEDVRSFCCRLSAPVSELKARGLWNMGNKTGALGVVTLNLNHLSKDGEDHFLENIDEAYDLSVEELLIKRNYILKYFEKGLLPFTKCYLPEKDPFKTFFNIIGIHAMNEACINMFGSSIENYQDFVIETLKYIRSRTDETSNETGLLFALEQTPCEGATYRLAKLDKKMGLPVQGKKQPYLTNSTHLPVKNDLGLIPSIKIQEKFNKYYNAGTIFHGFVGEQISPLSAKNLIEKIAQNTSLSYYNLTPTYSICKEHGIFSGIFPECPSCGKETYVYSRIVGYIQPVHNWNESKKEEFKDRKMFKI